MGITTGRAVSLAAILIGTTATTVAVPAAAAFASTTNCQTLPPSFGYSEFSPGLVTETHGDSDGPTAFGGSGQTQSGQTPINLGNFSISSNQALLGSNNVGFVAGGNVSGNDGTADSTSVHYGNGYYDGNISGVGVDNGYSLNAVSQSNLPVNFTTAAAADSALAAQLGALATTPGDTVATNSSTITLTATGTSANGEYVWNLPVGTFSGKSALAIVGVPTGATIIVNVPDAGSVTAGVNVTIDGQSSTGSPTATPAGTAPALANTTIFNFYGATTLNLADDWAGVLYAPGAAVTFNNGHVWGSVDGASLTGTSESTYGPLSAACIITPTSALPEGKPVEMIAGAAIVVLLAGGLVRRRRGIQAKSA